MLGIMGFYEELGHGQSGSLRDAMRSTGEPDEAEIVAYLESGYILIDVMEGGRDPFTGESHRHTSGCSSPVTDGAWLWRLDFPYYLETYHVALPAEFLAHVRRLDYRMQPLVGPEFAPEYAETMPVIGWNVTWPLPNNTVQPGE